VPYLFLIQIWKLIAELLNLRDEFRRDERDDNSLKTDQGELRGRRRSAKSSGAMLSAGRRESLAEMKVEA